MSEMNTHDIVCTLIGAIDPVGDSIVDNKRFANLREMTELVSRLVEDINKVASLKNCHEYSIKLASEFADTFLVELLNE